MKLKKILSLITVAVFMLAMVVVPASAEATTVIAVQDATVAPGSTVEVMINMTYNGFGGGIDITYDETALTYVEESFASLNASIGATDLSVNADTPGTISVTFITGVPVVAEDSAVFSMEFTAKETIEGASEETEITAALNMNGLFDANNDVIADENISFVAGTVTISLAPAAPVVTGVEILKDEAALEAAPMIGDVLAVDYDYSDVNDDEEDGTAFQWYADGVAIEEDADGAEYTVTAADFGKAITVGVTPANAEEKGDEGVEVESEATVAVIANPDLKATIVEDSLTIEPADKIRVGREVVVYYELNSPNGGADTSTIIWTDADGNELVGEVSEDGTTFTPDKEDKDKYIKVTVIPDDDRTEANEEAAVELVAEVPVTKKSTGTTAWDDNAGSSLAAPKTEDPVETDKPDETDKPVASGIEKFTDVDAEAYAWAVEGIDELVKAGIIVGVTDTTFEPETKTTRAHFVAMVMRAANAINEEAKASYADVATDFWGYKEIASAEALGALAIFGENFEPEKVITREEMAYVLYGVATALEIELAATEEAEAFSDAASIVEEAADAVTALQKAGILHGMGDGTFMPKGETTRAQAAKVVHLLWTAAK